MKMMDVNAKFESLEEEVQVRHLEEEVQVSRCHQTTREAGARQGPISRGGRDSGNEDDAQGKGPYEKLGRSAAVATTRGRAGLKKQTHWQLTGIAAMGAHTSQHTLVQMLSSPD